MRSSISNGKNCSNNSCELIEELTTSNINKLIPSHPSLLEGEVRKGMLQHMVKGSKKFNESKGVNFHSQSIPEGFNSNFSKETKNYLLPCWIESRNVSNANKTKLSRYLESNTSNVATESYHNSLLEIKSDPEGFRDISQRSTQISQTATTLTTVIYNFEVKSLKSDKIEECSPKTSLESARKNVQKTIKSEVINSYSNDYQSAYDFPVNSYLFRSHNSRDPNCNGQRDISLDKTFPENRKLSKLFKKSKVEEWLKNNQNIISEHMKEASQFNQTFILRSPNDVDSPEQYVNQPINLHGKGNKNKSQLLKTLIIATNQKKISERRNQYNKNACDPNKCRPNPTTSESNEKVKNKSRFAQNSENLTKLLLYAGNTSNNYRRTRDLSIRMSKSFLALNAYRQHTNPSMLRISFGSTNCRTKGSKQRKNKSLTILNEEETK